MTKGPDRSGQREALGLESWSTVRPLEARVRRLLGAPYNVRQYGGFFAQVRERYWTYIRRYDSELCQRCGRPYGETLWAARERLWSEVVGRRFDLLCPRCFGELAEERGMLLEWRPVVLARRDDKGLWDTDLSEDRDEVGLGG